MIHTTHSFKRHAAAICIVCLPAFVQAGNLPPLIAAPLSVNSDQQLAMPAPESKPASVQANDMLFKLSVNDGEGTSAFATKGWRSLELDRLEFMEQGDVRMYRLNRGLSYTAAIDVDNSKKILNPSEFISSRQLGVHIGRLGPINYSGLDLSYRRFRKEDDTRVEDDTKLWSFGMTTGRRFWFTGLEDTDPLWTISLRGQFDIVEQPDDKYGMENQAWYFSPGMHWRRDSFRLSADVLMPFLHSGEFEEEQDYRFRAKIQKQF